MLNFSDQLGKVGHCPLGKERPCVMASITTCTPLNLLILLAQILSVHLPRGIFSLLRSSCEIKALITACPALGWLLTRSCKVL